MLITVFGATGQVGKRIVNMALEQGYKVRAFGRNVESIIDKDIANENLEAVKGYVFDADEVYAAVNGADIVLSALGGGTDSNDKTRSLGIKNIIAQMQKAGAKRIMNVVGVGVLKDDVYEYILNKPGYPAEFLPVGKEHMQAYLYLKDSALEWTVVCAPDIINKDADGNYVTAIDYSPAEGTNKIAAGNIADFMLKEITERRYLQMRVGISDAK